MNTMGKESVSRKEKTDWRIILMELEASFIFLTLNKRRVGMFHFIQEATIITLNLCFDYMIVHSVMCIACRLRGVTIQLKHIMIYRDSLGLYWVILLFKLFF